MINGPSVPFQLLVYRDRLVMNSFSGEEPVLTFVPQLNRVWDVLFWWDIIGQESRLAAAASSSHTNLPSTGCTFCEGKSAFLSAST